VAESDRPRRGVVASLLRSRIAWGVAGLLAGFAVGLLVSGKPWNLPPAWGDIPTWITAIATIGLLAGVPVKRQLRSVIEAVAVVIGSAGQRLHGLVEVIEDLPSVLERPSFVLTSPSLSLPFSFSGPGLILTLPGPSLCDKPAGDSSGQCAQHADASHYERDPKRWCSPAHDGGL
jgi:hypothetical protein